MNCIRQRARDYYDAKDFFEAISSHNTNKTKRIVKLSKTRFEYSLDNGGCPPICLAAKCGHNDIVVMLLKYGFNPHIPDDRCWFPVHYAASTGNCDVIYVLVNRGKADVTRKCPVDTCKCKKQSALHAAVLGDQYDAVMTLLQCGCDVKALDYQGKTPLEVAKENGYTKIAESLETYTKIKA